MQKAIILPCQDLPDDLQWLHQQPCPVIAYGKEADYIGVNNVGVNNVGIKNDCADVVVPDLVAAQKLEQRIHTYPIAAMALVQVLRINDSLSASQALDVESMAFSTLQSGPEFQRWLQQEKPQAAIAEQTGEPLLLTRDGAVVEATLNRADSRNAISVEMRDAWVEALQLLEADASIEQLQLRALGPCFSTGGELREFGSLPDPAVAHWVRTVQSPARLLARLGDRVTCFLHGACIGSGIELPAFAARVVAHSKTYFQLPELQLGLIPGAGGTVGISRRIGRQRTAWMVLSGRRINAHTALQWGLIDEILDP